MVNFADMASAQSAIETLNNCMLPDGRFLRVTQWFDWKGKDGKGEKGEKGGKKGGKNGKGGGGLIKPSGTAGEAEGAEG